MSQPTFQQISILSLNFQKNFKSIIFLKKLKKPSNLFWFSLNYKVLQNLTSLLTQIKIARDDLFNSIKNIYTITELDRQKDTVLDTLIFAFWGTVANRGDLGLSGITFIAKPPYLILEGKFENIPSVYKQYYDSLQRYFKVLFEDFYGLKGKMEDFEKLRNIYATMMETAKEKVKDSSIGVMDRYKFTLNFRNFPL